MFESEDGGDFSGYSIECRVRRGVGKMKKLAVRALVVWFICVSLLFVVPAHASKTQWKFALEEITGSVQDEFAQFFKKKLMERLSDVEIEIYPVGILGDSEEITEQTMNGVLQLAMASPGHLGTFIPVVRVFSLPFIWSDNMSVNRYVMENSVAIYELMDREYAKHNLKLLGIFPEGWQIWSANKPLRKPEDFQNFRMRIMGDPLLAEIYNAYGGNAVQVPYPDLYSALQLKMVDGNIQPYFAHEEMKFYEQQDYLINPKEMPFIATFVTGLQWFESLPEEKKKIVVETAKASIDFIFDAQEEMNLKRRQKMLEMKPSLQFIDLTNEEREVFAKFSMRVRDTYITMAKPHGQEILDTLLRELKEAEAKILQQ